MAIQHPFTRQRCQQNKRQQHQKQKQERRRSSVTATDYDDTANSTTNDKVQVGSVQNNSNAPYFSNRQQRQRKMRINKKQSYIKTFLANAIQDKQLVIFTKNKTDPFCKKVEQFFLTNVTSRTLKSDMIVYHLDEMPCNGGVQIQNYLMKNYETPTSEHCHVFVRGEYVLFTQLEHMILNSLTGRGTSLVGNHRLSVIDGSRSSSVLSMSGGKTTGGGYDNSSWFYPSEKKDENISTTIQQSSISKTNYR